MIVLQTLPIVFVLAGLVFYVVLGGADFGAGLWQLIGARGDAGHAASATTPTTRWGRCGRPTTCG